MDNSGRSFDEIGELVRTISGQVDVAISLKQLCQRLNQDERIESVYDHTFEGRGFALIRSSTDYAFALALTRLNEGQKNSANLQGFFKAYANNREVIKERILARRMKYVEDQQARLETDGHLEQLDNAANAHKDLLGSHQWSRTKSLRDKFIAHNALDRDKVQLPKYGYLYELCDRTASIVSEISAALLGEGTNFSKQNEIWNDYAEKFLESMIAWRQIAGD